MQGQYLIGDQLLVDLRRQKLNQYWLTQTSRIGIAPLTTITKVTPIVTHAEDYVCSYILEL